MHKTLDITDSSDGKTTEGRQKHYDLSIARFSQNALQQAQTAWMDRA